MPARIQTLIDKVDNAELIRDEIAAILLLESTSQYDKALNGLVTPGRAFDFSAGIVPNAGDGALGALSGTRVAGAWTITCTAAAPGAGTFEVRNPSGTLVGTVNTMGAHVVAGLGFTLTAGATDFAIGDGFLVQYPPNPENWRLRIFSERSNPWAEYEAAEDEDLDTTPLVNVALDAGTYDPSKSDLFRRQHAVMTYNVDCYGCGRSTELPSGHEPGDALAGLAAQRAVRLVRNILMSAPWSYLGLRGLVARVWPSQLDIFQPQIDQRPVQHIVGARLALEVQFNEFSPQYVPEILEGISLEVRRNSVTGQLLLAGQFEYT